MCLYVLRSVLQCSLVLISCLCCPIMCLYVLRSVLQCSLVLISCLCCPIMCLYVLRSVLQCSLVLISCLCCPIMCLYVLRSVLQCPLVLISCLCCPIMCLYVLRSVLQCPLVLISCLCCPIMCLYVLRSVLQCPLRYPHINDVRFVFTSSCFMRAYVFFVLFFFVWLSVSLDCPFLIAPLVFSNVYLNQNLIANTICPHVYAINGILFNKVLISSENLYRNTLIFQC